MNSVNVWTSSYFYLRSSKSEVNHFNVNHSDTSLRKKSDLDTDSAWPLLMKPALSVIVYTLAESSHNHLAPTNSSCRWLTAKEEEKKEVYNGHTKRL